MAPAGQRGGPAVEPAPARPVLRADSPVQFLRGIGPARAAALATLGLHTVTDLLEFLPTRYEQDTGEVDIADLQPGRRATVRGSVTRVRTGRRGSVTAEIHDGTQACTLRWFQQPYSAQGLSTGAIVIATGPVREYDDRLELVQPQVQVFEPETVVLPPARGARTLGVYPGNAQVRPTWLRQIILDLLRQRALPVAEFLPPDLLARRDLPGREAALRQVHSPSGEADLQRARQRLAYEEFLLLELAMALRRAKRVALQVGRKLHVSPEIDQRIRARFPFALTPAQDQAVAEIAADLQSGRPMTRLLQGDVGSGKTVVALYACLAAIANRGQAAIMAPTEILAQQHFTNIQKYLAGSRVRSVLLRGQLPRGERAALHAALERGQLDLVVGTQALIQEDVAFAQLALVVVDEQHKFGVLQRATFRTKGPMPHYLVMTATPIPRTLSMTIFGDLDVSLIRAQPPGRGRVTTRVVTGRQWDTVMAYVRRRLEAGEQAYVVCPLIGSERDEEQSPTSAAAPAASPPPDNLSAGGMRPSAAKLETGNSKLEALVSARQAYQQLVDGPWAGLRVGLLHGALKPAEKTRIVEAFAAGDLHALVATTVVEVGMDVANATIMIVEHADRFGLSQLHQLRGRVGRGAKDALCVLIARGGGTRAARPGGPPATGRELPSAAQRLAVLAETTDGFQIAEADLRLRGPGELFGTRQHGLPELRFGNLVEDFALLEQARADAFELVRRDPRLEQPEHQPLLPALRKMLGEKLALIDAA